MIRYIFLSFLLIVEILFFCYDAAAQGEIMYTSSKELSSSMVNNIFQDDLGMVWISSEDGLDVCDGVRFSHVRRRDNDSLSLVSNYVRFVYQDTDNAIFVATLHGLQYFDKNTLQFHLVPFESGGRSVNIMPSIAGMCRVNDTLVLVGTSGYGMMRLRCKDGRYSLNPLPNVGYGNLNCMYKDAEGTIWLAANGNGVRHIAPDLSRIEEMELPTSEAVTAIVSDHDGTVFFGTTQGRVLAYDSNQPSKFREIVSSKQNDISVSCFCVNDDNSILLGTDGHGVKKLYLNNGVWSLEDYEFVIADNNRLKVHHIMCDRDGNHWFGCFQKGVIVVRDGGGKFDYVGHNSHKRNVIGDCCVVSVYADDDSNIYVGTDNDGIYVLDENYNFIRHYDCNAPGSLVPNVSLAICDDSYGRLWVGGYLGGLVYMDRKTGKWHRFELASSTTGRDDYASVYAIVEDKKTQTLWVSASGFGLYKIDEKTLRHQLFGIGVSPLQHDYTVNQICNTWVVSMKISSDRKLYIGTYSGFSCMDLDTESFVSTYGVNCFLEGYVVNNICEAPDRHIWLGTTDGLFDFDVNTRAFRRYGTADGLPGTSISGIACDIDGNVWISSKGGISCLDNATGRFVNYNAADGLYSNEFMPDAVCVSKKGKFLFGSVNGIIGFHPFERQSRNKELSLRIVDFLIDNMPVYKGFKSGGNDVVDTAVANARRFHLAHFDNSFEVVFSALEFENPDRLRYLYRFDGGQWNAISGNRVSFAKVASGEHTLEACVTDDVTTSGICSVTIEIDYPWYSSTWFYVLLALLVLALLVVAALLVRRRVRLNRHYKEIARAKELNDSRIEFFTSISHEIRTPISLIISPLYKLIEADGDPVRQRSYRTIKLNAQRILNLINQLLDMRKIDSEQMTLEYEKTDLVAFCRGIYESFEQYASSLGIEFCFESEDESLEVYIDPKNFDKVIVNLLSNAFKYTPQGGKVMMCLYKADRNSVGIDVSDQGTGLLPEDIDHIFDLFYQGGNNHKITMVGTGIGMYLVRKLVTLHHGEVKAINNPEGQGCTFNIRLPLGRAHLRDEEIFKRDEPRTTAFAKNAIAATAPELDDEELRRYTKTSTRLVVVDDDEELRKFIVDELGHYFHVKDFSNAEEALPYIITKKPDLVISDVILVGMDGFALCSKIKKNVDLNTIPVILLTAAAQDNSRIKALDIGADAYITKPFNIAILSHTITNLLKRNNTMRNRYQGRQDSAGVAESAGDGVQMADSPDKKLLMRVLKVINENMSNPNLTVDLIAKAVGISRVHLHRKLKELTNQSTIDFLRNVRLNRALKLLKIKHNSIFEVAQQVGFVSTAYFSTVFKDRFGCTPSAYMSDNATIEQMPLDDDELIS